MDVSVSLSTKALFVRDWDSHETTRAIQGDAMLRLRPGVWYHHRLNLIIILRSEIKSDD
jgi:hypothetical protein